MALADRRCVFALLGVWMAIVARLITLFYDVGMWRCQASGYPTMGPEHFLASATMLLGAGFVFYMA